MVPLAGWTVARPVFPRLEEYAQPAELPIDLPLLKQHLRITHNAEDSYLTFLISGATEIAERYMSRRIVSRGVRMWMDYLPGTGNDYMLYGSGIANAPISYASVGMFRAFALMGAPTASVESFEYITNDGVTKTYDPSNYIVDLADKNARARIILQRGAVWPVDLQVAHSLKINYTLGYGNAAAVPFTIKQAVMLIAAALWSNRGDANEVASDVLNLPGVQACLAPLRIMRLSTL